MSVLVVHPTAAAQWHALVHDAESAAGERLDPALESYLVFLLMRFAGRPEMAGSVLALEYLHGMLAAGQLRRDRLRDVGDQCLLYSGLFPRRAERLCVRVSYFVELGRGAYRQLATSLEDGLAEMYAAVSLGFVSLMDVLQTMRALDRAQPLMEPLNAYDLWRDTGGRQARVALRRLTTATPVATSSRARH